MLFKITFPKNYWLEFFPSFDRVWSRSVFVQLVTTNMTFLPSVGTLIRAKYQEAQLFLTNIDIAPLKSPTKESLNNFLVGEDISKKSSTCVSATKPWQYNNAKKTLKAQMSIFTNNIFQMDHLENVNEGLDWQLFPWSGSFSKIKLFFSFLGKTEREKSAKSVYLFQWVPFSKHSSKKCWLNFFH